MRRILYVFSGLLVILLLTIILFRMYRQQQSYAVAVPRDAASVIRVHVDELVTDVIWNMLWHPASYRQETPDGAGRLRWNKVGVQVPANLFLYQFADVPWAIFGMLPITDAGAFGTFVGNPKPRENEAAASPRRFASSHGLAFYTADTVAFAFFRDSGGQPMKAVESHLRDMLRKKRFVPLSASRFAALKKENGHINVMGNRSLWAEFRRGEVVFSAGAAWDDTLPWQQVPAGNTGVLTLPGRYWSQAGWDTWPGGNKGVLSRDSLRHYIDGTTTLQWAGTAMQIDTVIGYEYDEDFNPIETRETVERIVPALYGTVTADTRGLLGYLASQGILDTISGQVNREVFPFFPLYVGKADTTRLLIGSTAVHGKQIGAPIGRHPGDSLFLYLNIADAAGQAVFPQEVADLLAPFSAITLQGHETDAMAIRGKVTMKEPAINSLIQLYPFFGALQYP